VGCEFCNKIGYKSRTGLFEIMLVDDAIRTLIARQTTVTEIKEAAVRGGMRTLAQDGLEKVMHGITSLEEVVDVVSVE
jgi:type IV pilus assembly protein PilB